MDKIGDRKSEVIGRCGGDEKYLMTSQNRQKSNAKKTLFFHWHTCTYKYSMVVYI